MSTVRSNSTGSMVRTESETAGRDAGVGDQHVQPAEPVDGLCDRSIESGEVAYVCLVGGSPVAEFVGELLHSYEVPSDE